MNEWKARCNECYWKDVFESGEVAEKACLEHYDHTDHRDVWYGLAVGVNSSKD